MVDEKQVSEIVKNVIAGMDISSFDNKPARSEEHTSELQSQR